MLSLANNDLAETQMSALKTLLNCEQLEVLSLAAGGNSKVFCVQADGKKWAIKSYPPYAPNQRDRLAAESTAYQFLNQHNVPSVPQYKLSCLTERMLIIDWIDGQIPSNDSISSYDIEQAVLFINEIAKLNHSAFAKELVPAAEACLSLDIILEQIDKRLARLQQYTANEAELFTFLNAQFIPLYDKLKQAALIRYQQHGIASNTELALTARSLIPADFGFHNSLRDSSGKLHFFDFDYFGWDDPVKLLADILWHPKMSLSIAQQTQFINGIAKVYQHDNQFLTRFESTFPLYGLRWALILLNEFIPAFWQNRQHAAVHQDLIQAKLKQLNMAKDLVDKIS